MDDFKGWSNMTQAAHSHDSTLQADRAGGKVGVAGTQQQRKAKSGSAGWKGKDSKGSEEKHGTSCKLFCRGQRKRKWDGKQKAGLCGGGCDGFVGQAVPGCEAALLWFYGGKKQVAAKEKERKKRRWVGGINWALV